LSRFSTIAICARIFISGPRLSRGEIDEPPHFIVANCPPCDCG